MSDLLMHFGGVAEYYILHGWFGWSNDGTDTTRRTAAALQQTNTDAHVNWDHNDCCACRFLPGGVVHTQQQVEGTT